MAELYDYEWFFGGFPYTVSGRDGAGARGPSRHKQVVYFPRRSFDMWNTRYFVLPENPSGWFDEFRGYAAFLPRRNRSTPPPEAFQGRGRGRRVQNRVETQDFQVRRNRRVHSPRLGGPRRAAAGPRCGPGPDERRPMQEMLYADDPIWHDPSQTAFDPRRLVWIAERRSTPAPRLPGRGSASGSETVKVDYPSPQRAELDVKLETPGIVVLADIDYPGWKLTIDGQPAPIHPVNRMMRGAAVSAGPHRLVYTFEPRSFHIGRAISVGALAVLALLVLGSWVPIFHLRVRFMLS